MDLSSSQTETPQPSASDVLPEENLNKKVPSIKAGLSVSQKWQALKEMERKRQEELEKQVQLVSEIVLDWTHFRNSYLSEKIH